MVCRLEHHFPLVSRAIRSAKNDAGWAQRLQFGWFEDAKIESLRDAFVRAKSPEEQKKIATEIQKEVYEQVAYIPLGQYEAPSVWRKELTGILGGPATPVFWNIDKAE